MSALQIQLGSLRTHSTQEFNLRAQRLAHSKSLIFPPQEAASQTLYDIYQLCVRSFNNLCQLDKRFRPFGESIFSQESTSMDRSQMLQQELGRVDMALEEFMSLVAPKLQLRDAQVAMEWLVRRFRVHDDQKLATFLVLTFLPYHETPIFSAVVRLIPRPEIPYSFLSDYIQSKSNISSSALVRAGTRESSIFSDFNNHVVRLVRTGLHWPGIGAFWTGFATQILHNLLDKSQSGRTSRQLAEQQTLVSSLTQIVSEVLNVADTPDLHLACCSILIIIASKGLIPDKIVDDLMLFVVRTWRNSASPDIGMECVVILAEHKSDRRLSRLVAGALKAMRDPPVHERLLAIKDRVCVDNITLGICDAEIESWKKGGPTRSTQSVTDLIQADLISDRQVRNVIRDTIKLIRHFQRRSSLSEASQKSRDSVARLVVQWARNPHLAQLVLRAFEKSKIQAEELPTEARVAIQSLAQGDSAEPLVLVADSQVSEEDALLNTESWAIGGAENNMDVAEETQEGLTGHMRRVPSSFSHLVVSEATFFTPSPPSYDGLLTALADIAANDGVKNIRDQVPFQNMEQGVFTSFLVRAWSIPRTPHDLRAIALKAMADVLSELRSTTIDPQGLLPYLLCAVGDSDRKVRQAASHCLSKLTGFYSGKKENLQRARPLLGVDLYDKSNFKEHQLSHEDAVAFLGKSILPHLQACVTDNDNVDKVIELALNGHSEFLQTSQHDDADLRLDTRTSVATLLASHAMRSKLLPVQLRIISMMNKAGKSANSARHNYLIPGFRAWCELNLQEATEFANVTHSLDQANRGYLKMVTMKDEKTVALLRDIISKSQWNYRHDLQEPAFECLESLFRRSEPPRLVLDPLLDIAAGGDSADAQVNRRRLARRALDVIRFSKDTLVFLLGSLPSTRARNNEPSAAKRRRTTFFQSSQLNAMNPEILSRVLAKYGLVLSLVESSKVKHHDLLGGLFHTLAELLLLDTEASSSVEYLLQATTHILITVASELQNGSVADSDRSALQSVIRMDTLVDCVRGSTSPSVQNNALDLIAELASWSPDLVLHNVMPIFTFMSSSTLRNGDDYSINIVTRTLDTIVPPLAESHRRQNKDVIIGLSDILLGFVAAFEHIPPHRRLKLLEHLVKTLGPPDCLFAVVAMLVDRYPTDKAAKQTISDLMKIFGAQVELQTFEKTFRLLLDLRADKRTLSAAVLSLKDKNARQVQDTERHLLVMMDGLLASESFHKRLRQLLASRPERGAEAVNEARKAYARAVQAIIELCESLKAQSTEALESARSCLMGMYKIVPVEEMATTVSVQIVTQNDEVRSIALSTLQDELAQLKGVCQQATDALLDLMGDLCSLIQTTENVELKRQAIHCIDEIMERFGKTNTAPVLAAAECLASDAALRQNDSSICLDAILFLASTVEVLQDEFIPLIADPYRVLDHSFEIVEKEVGSPKFEELRDAFFALLGAVTQHVPAIVSAEHLDKALHVYPLTARGAPAVDESRTWVQFYHSAANNIDPQELFPALERNFDDAIRAGFKACKGYLEFISAAFSVQKAKSIRRHGTLIFAVARKGFDIRRIRHRESLRDEYSEDRMDTLDEILIDVVMLVIKKMNDEQFNPIFYSLVDWASKGLPQDDVDGRMLRTTSLFRFLEIFMADLHETVTHYATTFLPLATNILKETSPRTEADIGLLRAVLATLQASFEHDRRDFWQEPRRFDNIADPLLEQVARCARNEQALSVLVAKTLESFVLAAYRVDQRVHVNEQLLKLLKHEEAKVRIAAIGCQIQLLDRLGDDWTSMLSQMLPAINEVLEDDSEEVEKQAKKWVRKLEKTLNQDIKEMLQ